MTETWLDSKSDVNIDQFQASHSKRSTAFDASCTLFRELSVMQHGGVSVFYREGIMYEEMKQLTKNLECVVFKMPLYGIIVAIIYRTQKYQMQKFMEVFRCFINQILSLSERVIVNGDFSEDIASNRTSLLDFMLSKGFIQYIENPTTENGTLIDHVYVKGCPRVKVSVPTYFSYHEAVTVDVNVTDF